ncbi:hypothetical protein P872_05965 [Rhodonellum psychrophilum GCM71 = DSM 17998]|uniref:Calcineurin-like phosphoesterase domain-containing protein n=2 Tax=Rhodonellum TaxID=336827 RepID=U5C492_9BACT|nr:MULTISPECIES: metallophosphoesterase family protein [Rhodonellum]ERM83017.1 hypothetical protein P872_05965 [Rhodonellum psychrophilum GCM71 = DSM 17998]SDZ47776.1 Purple acid Phosphatase, N-terminal domain [Rhodonellum ikkaensis]
MKKYLFYILIPFSGFLSIQYVNAQDYAPKQTPDRITLHLGENPATSFSINYRTSSEMEESYIQVSLENSSPDLEKYLITKKADKKVLDSDGSLANYFTVSVDGLDPETLYVYRIGNDDSWSEWNQVTTASSNLDTFSFIYLGDIQNNIKSLASRVIRKSYSHLPNASFILYSGDLINRTHNDQEWGEWYEAGGWINSQVPVLATPGNHEYTRDEERNLQLDNHWDKQFSFQKNGPAPYQSSVYYQDYGNMRIISLDTQLIMLDSISRQIQKEWLDQVLKTTENKWKIILMHHPVYSVSHNRDNPILRDLFQPIFEKHDVDLVLQGHDHTYGRGFKPMPDPGTSKGPMYIVSVAGPKMYTPTLDRWTERSGANIQLYQLISVKGDRLSYESFTTDGKKYDGFDLSKNPGDNKFELHDHMGPEKNELPAGRLEKLSQEEINSYNKIYKTNY